MPKGFQKGNKSNLGKKFSEEHRRKISESCKGRKNPYAKPPHITGEKSSHWKGGISKQDGYRLMIENRRRARKFGNGGTHTVSEWDEMRKFYKYSCLSCCRVEPEIKLTKDHIIPISKGGSDNIENIQPLCQSCNTRKSAKTIKYDLPSSIVVNF
jgi:5-methylcytosine-specific restriction endonuclease McrA